MTEHLRPYQQEAVASTLDELATSQSTLVVMPTGCGKTETALATIQQWPDSDCDVLCLSHREELVRQPAERWARLTGDTPDVEMAEQHRGGQSRVTFASKDSLRPERLLRVYPDPSSVGLIWVDEAHHAAHQNRSYQHILDYFLTANPDCRVIGTTATPDRADEVALGETFASVAYDYPIYSPDGGASAIGDGWLAPIEQEFVEVADLDFDIVGTRAGDFVDAQLEELMCRDEIAYQRTAAIRQLVGQQTTLCFAAGIKQTIIEASIHNAHSTDSARAIVSKIPADLAGDRRFVNSRDRRAREQTLKAWGRSEFPYLCNVGVFTEGMDEPGIAAVSMGRPTMSRSLYAQMVGRSTRVLPDVIEGLRDSQYWRFESAEERRAAIAESAKPFARVIDFTGSSRKHKLITAVDILGGRYDDEVVERAKSRGGGGDVVELLSAAAQNLRAEQEQRRRIRAKATRMSREKVDPFRDAIDLLGGTVAREPGWAMSSVPTQKQVGALRRFRVEDETIDKLRRWQATQMLDRLISRANAGLATYRQAKTLARFGESTDVTFDEASRRIDAIAKNKWRPLVA